ncbi:MAG: penicillin-binding protein 2 [Oscillospiraceae bacterium]|nr:penicillin-binding protein 2 [Oscillospiraceae bacterium]
MIRRMAGFLCLMVILMGGVLLRVAYIGSGGVSVEAAALQSMRTIELAESRAGIFDRNLSPFVNKSLERRLLIFPDLLEIPAILEFTDREELAQAFQKFEPSVMDTGGKIIEGEGIYNFSYPRRYGENPIAVHIIGYMNGGVGVSGIEQSYNGFLEENGESVSVTYYTDGTGKLLIGEEITLNAEETAENCGVVLTLDSDIQRAAEKALASGTEKGAAVVMDIKNGEILASASCPEFDPSNIADYLDAEDSPFINRAFSAYTVGSTWKLVVAASAIEAGITAERTYECTGSIEVDGRIYKCHWELGHGEIDMKKALEISCNPYFIDLALEIGGERILETAKNLGFGTPASFGENYSAAAGSLPAEDSLSAKTVLASFAFGQGSLMANPVQMAVLASAIANGGKAVTPKLVLGTYDREGNYTPTADYAANPVMSAETAKLLQDMMINVVENGSGINAKPKEGSAGGKTASAQTGQYDSEGNEIIHAWFVGFYPAENPKYAIAVFAEGMDSGGDFAAPIFKSICDGINLLNND